MAPQRIATPLERRLLAALGPRSTTAKSLLTRLTPSVLGRSLEPFLERWIHPATDDAAEADRSDLVARRLYLLLVSRALLLECTGAGSLADVPWRFPDHTGPWDWVDELGGGSSETQIRQAVRSALVSDEDREGDPLRALYESMTPAKVRKRRGEHFTPAWLADHVVDAVWTGDGRWLDPTAGVGSFGLAADRRRRREGLESLDFVGIERDFASFTAAAASLAWVRGAAPGRLFDERPIGLILGDVLSIAPPADLEEGFDRIVGNPPWVLWDRYTAAERAELGPLWGAYGLRTERGMQSILGGGKRDVSMLVTLAAADRWLKPGGELSFVLPCSVFRSTASAKGFRRWKLPSGVELSVERVDDFSRVKVFPQASVQAAAARIRKSSSMRYPVPYYVWRSRRREDAVACWARPSDQADATSAWTYESLDSRDVSSVLGRCDYRARLGVNTGGAGGVYWFRKIGEESAGVWRMANLASRGRRAVQALEVEIESDLLFPALLGRDVRRFQATPSAWLLFVQDPVSRRGIDPQELVRRAPKAMAYLDAMAPRLRERAALRRYFSRLDESGRVHWTAPFYTMFNVGRYTLSPWKVVWNRMGGRMGAAAVGDREGRLVMPQETHSFFPVDGEDEAYYLVALLNSPWVQEWLERNGPAGGKSFATPGVVGRMAIRRFEPGLARHARLAELGRSASRAAEVGALKESLEEELRGVTADYWGIRL